MLCEYCGHRPVQHVAINGANGNIKEPPPKKAKKEVGQPAKTLEFESEDKLDRQEFTSEEKDHESELAESEVKHSNYIPYSLPCNPRLKQKQTLGTSGS